MRNLEYYIVDVFAEDKYCGNQLAVFMNTAGLETDEMQSIALETGFAETTFIESGEKVNGGYNVRIFTPETELPFAGHPTLGTAYIISKFIDTTSELILMNYPVGQVPVKKETLNQTPLLKMTQVNPSFGSTLEVGEAARILGLQESDFLSSYPVLQVSTGIPFYIVPLNSLEAVKKITVNHEAYGALHERTKDQPITPAFMSFSTETYHPEHQINCRMHYMENGQMVEDAATGSANGCLLSYLLKLNYFNSDTVELKAEQGFEIKRPSIIYYQGRKIDEENYEIMIGGRVILISKGEWYH